MTDNAQRRQVLVIGGAGYIGSVLVRTLLSNGCTVRVLDDLIYGNGSAIAGLYEHPAFSFVRGDFRDRDALGRSLEGATDVVLLAALVGDPVCKKLPDLARATNLDGPMELFDRLNGRGIDRFVFTSTCSNYGLRPDDKPAAEDAELNPQSLYAETKVGFERHLLEHQAEVDFAPTILRLATAYGLSHRMRFDLTVAEFTLELTRGRELLVYDEETWRPYCHVADISDAILRVLQAPPGRLNGEVLNVGSNEENCTKKRIVELVLDTLGGGDVRYKSGGFDPRNYRVSFDKIAARLGFRNRHSVGSSVPRLVQAIRDGCFDDVDARGAFHANYRLGDSAPP